MIQIINSLFSGNILEAKQGIEKFLASKLSSRKEEIATTIFTESEFKKGELNKELGHEINNVAISINGKVWKVIKGGTHRSPELNRATETAKKIVNTLNIKGRNASWEHNGMPVTEEKEEPKKKKKGLTTLEKINKQKAASMIRLDHEIDGVSS